MKEEGYRPHTAAPRLTHCTGLAGIMSVAASPSSVCSASRTLRCRYSDSAKPPTRNTKLTGLRFSAASTSRRCMWPQMGSTQASKKAVTTAVGSTREKERGRYTTAAAPVRLRAAL